MKVGSALCCSLEVSSVALFRIEPACPQIQNCNEILLKIKCGVALLHICRRKDFVGETMLVCAPQCSLHKHSVFAADHQTAMNVVQHSKIIPQLVCPLEQRNVHRMLEVHLADDSAVTMRRSISMPWHPSLETEYCLTAHRTLRSRCAAHCSESCNDHVVFHWPSSCS